MNNVSTANTAGMEVLVFRTNIRFKKDLRQIAPELDSQAGIRKWNVDREDSDKILRIETSEVPPEAIIAIIHRQGYFCEELPG